MKLLSVIIKSLKEQIRSYWLLLLSLSMGPFFIFVYYLILESEKPEYKLLFLNNDSGALVEDQAYNHGSNLSSFLTDFSLDSVALPITLQEVKDRNEGIERVKNKKADALIIIHEGFSGAIESRRLDDTSAAPRVEFIGDLTNTDYLISAIWANEIIHEYSLQATGQKRAVEVKETALGISGTISDFDLVLPGILIVSLIMLMFTASIAFVGEVENKTITRLKLSKISAFEFVGGIGFVQLLVGIVSVVLTLITSLFLGFKYSGSLAIMLLVASLTSFSIISFSLIIAAFTKSSNEVLVVGNFPMFLFMFFTGAAFPMKSEPWFTIAGYPVNLQGLMSPTHAISALNKTLIMDMPVASILPEMTAIVLLTLLYFGIGAYFFQRRHLKLA